MGDGPGEMGRNVPIHVQLIVLELIFGFDVAGFFVDGQDTVVHVPIGRRLPSFAETACACTNNFCAACNGSNAKGRGPLAPSLKVAPPDLTTPAKRCKGKFPYNYVSSILYFWATCQRSRVSAVPTCAPSSSASTNTVEFLSSQCD